MALNLNLKAGEKIAINGAVIVNGDRRADLTVETQARILRQGDIMQPEQANTPARRLYFATMMLYLEPENIAVHAKNYEQRITELTGALIDADALNICTRLAAHVANGELYKALGLAQELIIFEATRLPHVA